MGLDITAYSKLRAVGQHVPDGQWCDEEDHVTAFAYDSFEASFRGLPILDRRAIGGSSFIWGGCYEITDKTVAVDFGAGSYPGYSRWREDLARQFNPAPILWDKLPPGMGKPDPDLPFYELIWFADNEGTIGELAAADLLADFTANAASYAPKGYEWEIAQSVEKYTDWAEAFRLAADGGLVRFH